MIGARTGLDRFQQGIDRPSYVFQLFCVVGRFRPFYQIGAAATSVAGYTCRISACGAAEEPSTRIVTSAVRGAFRDDRAQGAEVLNLILNSRRFVPA